MLQYEFYTCKKESVLDMRIYLQTEGECALKTEAHGGKKQGCKK